MKHRFSSSAKIIVGALASIAFAPSARAQFDNQWLSFVNESSRIKDVNGANATYITTLTDEKDFAVGDLNRDGWVDVVMVCKQPISSTGHRRSYLLMNEGGNLVDRTNAWATASTVAGDQGFLTPTNNRDVQIADLNGDGWPDVVTATTLSDGDPKYLSHPRVYINLGSVGGVWQGLRFDEPRIPQLLTVGGLAVAPRFCSVSVGDVTGDGAPDLYFADYDGTETGIGENASNDLNDRLLINDGNGYFTDSITSNPARMSTTMLLSAFGTASEIADLNGDGVNDIIKVTTLTSPTYVSVAYNNPANVGYFNIFQNNAGGGTPYHVNVGDLNKDGRLDFIVSDDGADYYKLNQGNDGLGRVNWSPNGSFQWVSGTDGGFAGTNEIVDLDRDGWGDAIITDVDVDLSGCSRRCHIYHNQGGTVGGAITLMEEAGSSPAWKGVNGMLSSDLTGTFDVAVLDLDRDGDLDMIFGRCSGTFVWMNQQSSCPLIGYGTTSPNSAGSGARIDFQGTSSKSLNNLVLKSSQAPPSILGLFFYGSTQYSTPVPLGNGLRWIGGSLARLSVTSSNALGQVTYPCDLNAFPMNSLLVGDTRYTQFWYRDPAAGGANYNATDALIFTICP